MNKEIKEFCNKVWNEEARRQLEAELNFMSKEKIELPKGKDYLELFAKTHKTDEEIMKEKDKEIERLNNIIDEFDKWLLGENMMFYKSDDGERLIRYGETKNKWLELKEGKENE